ncbi:MAG: hypothetical protein ACJAS4_001482 [Bacteriovoracaceae bacterium]|jgi:hypothetical protein
MKILILLSLLVQATTVFAINKSILIDVPLSPAGSFQISSKRIKGKVKLSGSKISASNIKIAIKSLKTGIALRDNHLQKKLGIEKDPKANLLLVSAEGFDGKGQGVFKVLDQIQKVSFTYQKISDKLIQAKFKLSLKEFKIKGISYMGVGVQDIVSVKISLPFKTVE